MADCADLPGVCGIGIQYPDLLEAAGVDTFPELAQRKPENLQARILEANESKKLIRKAPPQFQAEGWAGQAKELLRVVTH